MEHWDIISTRTVISVSNTDNAEYDQLLLQIERHLGGEKDLLPVRALP